MAMFIARDFFIDTDVIAFAFKSDGVEQNDGRYFITLTATLGEKQDSFSFGILFNNRLDRDKTFKELADMMKETESFELNELDEEGE